MPPTQISLVRALTTAALLSLCASACGGGDDGGSDDAGAPARDAGERRDASAADAGVASPEDAGTLLRDGGSRADATTVPIDAGLRADAGAVDATDDAGASPWATCGGEVCGADERCVFTCCKTVTSCTRAATAEACPTGTRGVLTLPSGVLCPPIPGGGGSGAYYCINGDCPLITRRDRHCVALGSDTCDSASASCAACGESCYGAIPGAIPNAVLCTWDPSVPWP